MCTGIHIKAKNGAIFYGRTLEFGRELQSNILMIPRKYDFIGSVPYNVQGLRWTSRYAIIGANLLGLNHIADGINEKGLAGGLFYFPGFAEYQKEGTLPALAPWELLTYLLSTCMTIQEVKEAVTKIVVASTVYEPWKMVPPIHYILHDAQGYSCVIEYIKGNLKLRDNPLGVFTNSPNFDWHLTNLRNYCHLSTLNDAEKNLDGVSLTPFGQGSGFIGLPGDFMPSSRFVRAVFLSKSLIDIENGDDARLALFHVLNLFNIPKGAVAQQEGNSVYYDYTQWTSGVDLTNKRYYWHTYNNPQLCMVDLTRMNMDGSNPVVIQMKQVEQIVDKTIL